MNINTLKLGFSWFFRGFRCSQGSKGWPPLNNDVLGAQNASSRDLGTCLHTQVRGMHMHAPQKL